MKLILETERLMLREMDEKDLPALIGTLEDRETMYAYGGAFSREETISWLEKQKARYREDGFGLWAVIDKSSGSFLGQCGLTIQTWNDEKVLEIGYLFSRANWGKGYAMESARAVRDYAFSTLKAKEVCSIIRSSNCPSMRVAIRNGMVPRDTWTKHYRGIDMDHIRFILSKEEFSKNLDIQ